ncbi:hypothetical protein [uncultured Sulfitobacter sp.]|uniref:hypothetical protein n=1 Tax=uncultured Sulfitobacter sp. TaxID=191468 RepID=UPI0026371833|nr:hypothetical protein [uncultured Sulfitobacter sp.]
MPFSTPLPVVSGIPTTGPASQTQATTTVLAPTLTVTTMGASGKSSGGMASGGSDDQARASFEQQAAARTRRTLPQPSGAVSASVVDAQVADDKPPLQIHNPFDEVAPPDPLPTAPILKHLSDERA